MDPNSSFFDCKFLYTADAVRGDEPYVVFQDKSSDPFTVTLIAACRRSQGAVCAEIDLVADFVGLVFVEAPVWHRNHARLAAAGVRGDRVRVLFYFDFDPSGYWDFAKAAGAALPDLLARAPLSGATLEALTPFLEQWISGRPVDGRFSSAVGFANRDYAPLVQSNGNAIARIFSHFADDVSRQVYARILFGTPEEIFAAFSRQVFGEQQYMEIVDFKPGDSIVNCGVNRGWELPYFLCKTGGRAAIYNIDPTICYDSSPYGGLIGDFEDRITNLRLIAGASDGTIDLPVADADMIQSSATLADADVPKMTFPMRSIDSMVEEGIIKDITYLKMDVEGGEKYILEGSMQAIKKLRPKLAVAIYHEPHHFWEYPTYLLDNLQDYKFYLRQYGYSRFETLLYCIPREQVEARSGEEALGFPLDEARLKEGAVAACYLRDLRPRDFYLGPKRLLTRFEGRSWRSADLTPSVRVDDDVICGMLERGEETYILARHRYEDGQTRFVLGRCGATPLHPEWVASYGCAHDATCLLVPGVVGGVGIASFEPGAHISVGIWRGGEFTWIAATGAPSAPVYVHAVDEGRAFEMFVLDDMRRLIGAVFDAKGKIAGRDTALDLPGDFEGVISVKTYVEGVQRVEIAFALRPDAAGLSQIVVPRNGTAVSLGRLRLGDGAAIVPLHVGTT
ncbi:FkbM family methyltransferase [Caulobacter sp. LARHSG274]